jgi:hypothetical protein
MTKHFNSLAFIGAPFLANRNCDTVVVQSPQSNPLELHLYQPVYALEMRNRKEKDEISFLPATRSTTTKAPLLAMFLSHVPEDMSHFELTLAATFSKPRETIG